MNPETQTISDTPETDSEANNGSLCDQCVPADFARNLERERDAYEDALRRIYDISSDRRRSGKENELTWPDSVQISVIARNILETL